VQHVIRAVKAGNAERIGDRVIAAGVELEPGEYEVRLAAAHPASTAELPGGTGLVELDTTVTPALAAEGTARDVVRVVQQARRDAGLAVSDRIRLTTGADGEVAAAIRAHADFIARETLAVELTVLPVKQVGAPPAPVGDGGLVTVAVELAAPAPMPSSAAG
jgi:isoleucyl-tRNA synthetase